MKQKLFFVFALLLGAASLPVQAQQVDTTYWSSYWEQKATLFRLLPDTPGEIIFLGNSITDIGEWAEIWQNPKVRNRGISGDNTFGVLARLDEVTSSKPARVYLMIGINDIAKGTPDSVIIANYIRILERIRAASPGTRIIAQSILPTNDAFSEFRRHQGKDEHIRAVNKALAAYCGQKDITWVDLSNPFCDAAGKLDKRFTNDGLHLNGAGYLHWKNILIEKGLKP